MSPFLRVRRGGKSFFRVKLGKSVAKCHTFEIGPEGANGPQTPGFGGLRSPEATPLEQAAGVILSTPSLTLHTAPHSVAARRLRSVGVFSIISPLWLSVGALSPRGTIRRKEAV